MQAKHITNNQVTTGCIKLLRILQQKPSRTHTVSLYRTYHTLPVQLLYDYQILVFTHKNVHHRDQLPSVFSAYFDENVCYSDCGKRDTERTVQYGRR